MNDKYKKLQEQLTAKDIELKVKSCTENGMQILLYKTERVDAERLSDIFGGKWKREHYIDANKNVVCKISIYDEEIKEWISRENVGDSGEIEKIKGCYTDSFKRAGYSWGIGTELYNSPFIWINNTNCPMKQNKAGKFEPEDRGFLKKCVVSKFEIVNQMVFVEIKKDSKVIFTNFEGVDKEKSINTKEEAKAVVEKIQMDFEKEKTKLLETKDITQLKTIFTTIYNNKSLFTPEQFIELETIKNNKKEDFEKLKNENTITPTNIGA